METDILLNDILQLSQADLNRTKIRLNRNNGVDNPIDIFKRAPRELLGWNFWNSMSYKKGDISIGFVDMGMDRWLLFTVAEVDSVDYSMPKNTGVASEFHELDSYKKYFGRIIVKYHNTSRQLHRLANSIINELKVVEILPSVYTGFDFPGYDKVRISWQELSSIVHGNYPGYQNALRRQKAVYLQTDKSNGKLYVGSATSDNGMLLARWTAYADNGHGGNVELVELVKRHGFDYIKQNFQYTILENFNQSTPDSYVLERESYWKEVFQSRIFGYNKN